MKIFILFIAIFLGSVTGIFYGPKAQLLKPLSEIFLNTMFAFVLPLIFFSITSAIASLGNNTKAFTLFLSMLKVFVITGLIAAIYMLIVVKIFPFSHSDFYTKDIKIYPVDIIANLKSLIRTNNFSLLNFRENIIFIILLSLIAGLMTAKFDKSKNITKLLKKGADVFIKITNGIMLFAPLGFFAYIAVLTSNFGIKIFSTYGFSIALYYSTALLYFFIFYSIFAFYADRQQGVVTFWKNIGLPTTTALATCSSSASMPCNLMAAKNMRIPISIYELVIPIGTIIHKEGSILGGMIKIAFLFSLFHLSFNTVSIYIIAVITSILVGTVMGAIPSGGMIGEILILTVFGFPKDALLMISMISLLIDPLATVLNVTGNTIACMLVKRITTANLTEAPIEAPLFNKINNY